jgi:hypothetical protein
MLTVTMQMMKCRVMIFMDSPKFRTPQGRSVLLVRFFYDIVCACGFIRTHQKNFASMEQNNNKGLSVLPWISL